MHVRERKVLTSIMLMLVVISTTVIIIIWKGNNECRLRRTKPPLPDFASLKNLTSPDNEAIASFAGFLTYAFRPHQGEVERIHLPLQFKSLTHQAFGDSEQLILITNCAKIILSLRLAKNKEFIFVQNIRIDLGLAHEGVTSCEIQYPNIRAEVGRHYACRREGFYTCTTKFKSGSRDVAHLRIYNLEFEIFGNPNNIKQGLFSSPPTDC